MARNPKVRTIKRSISVTRRGCSRAFIHAVNPAGSKLWRKAKEGKL